MSKWSEIYSRLTSSTPSIVNDLMQKGSIEPSVALAIISDYHFIATNQATLDYFQSSEQDFLHCTPYDLSPRIQSSGRNSLEYGQQMLNEASLGRVIDFNWLHISSKGTELPTKVTLYPVKLDDSDVVLIQFTAIDRREKCRAHINNGFQDLPKALMTITLEDSAEAVYITNEDNQILAVNKAMCRICGYSAEHMLAKSPQALGLEQDNLQAVPMRSLASKDNWQGEVWKYRSDGTKFPAWQSCRRIYAEGIVYFVNLFSDISEKNV